MDAEPTDFVSVIALSLFRAVMVELGYLEAADAVRPNAFQTNQGENGHSLTIVVLAALVLESAINRTRYVRRHAVKVQGKHEPVISYFARTFPEPDLCREIEETFVVRDAIVHNHLYTGTFEWDREAGFRVVRRPRRRPGYGDKKLKRVRRRGAPLTRRLGLNLVPTTVWRRDAYVALLTAFRCLEYLEGQDRRYFYVTGIPFVLNGRMLNYEQVVVHLEERLAALPR